ncbi:carboxylating nicotinate-nucleotide diphosphorylase [Oceanidesulfovibrio indonesiensis]|uniref:nicotinate-nucleotide diphosphorylase (carboxylating) n=1 Tax=Oceanidesulfovibrio indonesiensis TaxID=54767 RepID=A0A7M3MG92_9BACT|nr:carboxylating nicotinate-nucleotide diphosphorylase [Oceanidesulfovibrio indonesiensis]TVM18338.1 carboxylating nicotinate-nucleotide diphosphorylase [Oceanidesulfovibrio indonesiensis]
MSASSVPDFDSFFTGPAREYLLRAIDLALEEDGEDLTSRALFHMERFSAVVVAKESCAIAGLPIVPMVLVRAAARAKIENPWTLDMLVRDGDVVQAGTEIFRLDGPALLLLTAERVILNFLCHLSGIATLTRRYVDVLAGTGVTLLDTRKTLPGLRYPEKYATAVGGAKNHRKNLSEMIMLKDNHIDRAGNITAAVAAVRGAYAPCPPIEAECRNLDEVREAVASAVDRIMLDNMDHEAIREALRLIPGTIETELSGGVDLGTLADLAALGPQFISVGRLTHSAPYADLSMRMGRPA